MTEMKIEEGKVYKRRDGLKAFDVVIDDEIASYSFERDGKIRSDVVFVNSGLANYDTRSPYDGDLIEEWKEEKLPKFQVGDRVNSISGMSFDEDWQNVVIHKIDKRGIWAFNEKGKEGLFIDENKLKLVTPTPKSPVVEKTVKSIEPGVYGRFEVDELLVLKIGEPETTTGISLRFVDIYGNPEGPTHRFTAEELESAAKTFNEIAEYLRGRG